ncbi:Thermostable beta-glucosidase B [Ruegeria sp. THAF57]|uniref:glycoside hydrolase family 3 C-terminal domain-containing protein n=1 Tax=Ruegeria sp. THAF57 TaxID=2744555 RepID=UPI0015DDFB99|nr:glycoside hydrolase family 3 C-terminal domain-containing protein [Ruegeria sp. THAF57]CAD0183958.1 Thermostable beta-glucosidase B [Ruegeria sp. THAF57]
MGIGPKNYENKASDILHSLSVEEKAALCSGEDFWSLKSLDRHGIGPLMVTDGPHGLRKQKGAADHMGFNHSVPATCFPTASALAATWNTDLMSEIGRALGAECRHEGVSVLLGPGINIKRHPTCGRNFEYFSEDPYVSGKLAAALVEGLQSEGVGACVKHFAANNQETQRMVIDTLVDERTLREIYCPAFETVVKEAQPWSVMCAYNRLNGTFCSDSDYLLNKVLRQDWGFEGLVMTDWGGQNDRVEGVKAGMDLEMPGNKGVNDARIAWAVRSGQLSEADLDKTVLRILKLMLAATDRKDGTAHVDMQAHHDLARRAAEESAVLLKNDGGLLPLKAIGKIAVIGGFAETPRFQGAGSSQVNPWKLDTPLDALRTYLEPNAEVSFARGFDADTAEDDPTLIAAAVEAAQNADKVVLLAGLTARFEAEGVDRDTLALPAQVNRLVEAVTKVNPNTVVILSNGSAIEMPWINEVQAVMTLQLAGQAGANALPRILFGDVSPSGKLAETYPMAMEDCASDAHFPGEPRRVIYREGLNIGYRYFVTYDVPVQFPFGHGLSYTRFQYSDLKLHIGGAAGEAKVVAELTVTNTGNRAGAEIVQFYVRDQVCSQPRPKRELKGFHKVMLEPGESKTVRMDLPSRAFSFYDVARADWVTEDGDFDILVGASVTDIRLSGKVTLKTGNPARRPTPERPAISMSDAQFTGQGGVLIPQDKTRPFTPLSTLHELQETRLGRLLFRKVVKDANKMLGGHTDEEAIRLRDALLSSLPMRNLVTMSNGAFSPKMLDMVLLMLNGRYGAAFKRGFKG